MIAECPCRWRDSKTPCKPHSHSRLSVTQPWTCWAHEHELSTQ